MILRTNGAYLCRSFGKGVYPKGSRLPVRFYVQRSGPASWFFGHLSGLRANLCVALELHCTVFSAEKGFNVAGLTFCFLGPEPVDLSPVSDSPDGHALVLQGELSGFAKLRGVSERRNPPWGGFLFFIFGCGSTQPPTPNRSQMQHLNHLVLS